MKKLYLPLLLYFLFSCKTEEGTNINIDVIKELQVFDVGMANDASDVYLIIEEEEDNMAQELRIVLIPGSSSLTANIAMGLPQDRYLSIPVEQLPFKGTMDGETKDSEGNNLTTNIDYKVQIILVVNDEMAIASKEATIKLVTDHPLSGNYRGTWDDNLYSNFPITARLTFFGDNGSGPFFYTGGFTSCCGGNDDGDISLKITGTTINTFIYNQDLIDFMGGCPGNYSGEGNFTFPFTFSIDFTGNDCEGPHTGGKIVLRKIN